MAIAEAAEAEAKQQKQPPPRKRGRPRKIITVEKTGAKKEEESKASETEGDEIGPKRARPGEEVVLEEEEEAEAAAAEEEKEDNRSEDTGRPITRSRGRGKSSEPRKSS